MPQPATSPIANAATYDALRDAQASLSRALNLIAVGEQCGYDCQQWRQVAQQYGAQLDRIFGALFPTGLRPRS